MTTAQQWREAAIELRRQAEIFEETARMVESLTTVRFPSLCSVVSQSGPNGEPLACAYVEGHDGDHSWATLPTWTRPGPTPEPAADMCHNGHPFAPGIDVDMAAGGREPDPRWCNVCGETRPGPIGCWPPVDPYWMRPGFTGAGPGPTDDERPATGKQR